ncbi:MAG TPA: MFS transporter [Nocardioidaceae bacterium]|nr:MFS transporter [Nocardioidaceae bacterium]
MTTNQDFTSDEPGVGGGTATSTRTGSFTLWRDLPTTVWILVLARAVNRLGAFTLPFLAVILVQDSHASVSQAGYLLAGFGLATIPSRLFGGRLSDAVGCRTTILVGLVGTAAAQLLVSGAQSLVQAGVAVIVLGLVFEIYEPPSQAVIADVTPADRRPVAFGVLAAAMAVAGMGAGLLAALVAGIDLRWLFVIDAATCLACAALVGVLLPATAGRGRDRGAEPVRAWSDPRLLAMLAVGTAFAVVYLQVTIALPLTLTQRGQPVSAIGVLLSVSAGTVVLAQPLVGRPFLRGMDDFSAMAVGFVVLAAGLLATGFATTLPAFVAAAVVWSLGDLLLLGRAYTIVAGIAPDRGRGRYLAVYGVSWGIAAVAAPLIGTQLLDRGGPRLAWTCVALTCLVLAALQPRLRRRLR